MSMSGRRELQVSDAGEVSPSEAESYYLRSSHSHSCSCRQSHSRGQSRSRRPCQRRFRSEEDSSGREDAHPEEAVDPGASCGIQPQLPAKPDLQPGAQKLAKILLCSEHGNNLSPDICNACRGVSRMVRQDMVHQLVGHRGGSLVLLQF